MSNASPNVEEKRPANLTALQHDLKEMAARTRPASKQRPGIVQGPVLVIRGK